MNFENAQKNDLTRSYFNFKKINQNMRKKNNLNHSINLEHKRNIPLTLKSIDSSFGKTEEINNSTISTKNMDKNRINIEITPEECKITKVLDLIKDTKIKIRINSDSKPKESEVSNKEKSADRIQINHFHLNINKPNIKFMNIDKSKIRMLDKNLIKEKVIPKSLETMNTIDKNTIESEKGANFIFYNDNLKKVKNPILIKNHPQMKEFFESQKGI
jgi:hypothetical protein